MSAAQRTAIVAAVALALAVVPTVAGATVDLPRPTLTGIAGDDDWFTGAVTVKWAPSGETSTSGCDTQHLTADTTGAVITCTASAGPGDSVTRTVTVRIDQTPPTALAAIPARPPDAGSHYTAPLPIAWSATDPTSGIAACTALTYTGPDGPAVAPSGTCRDRAGNVTAPLAFTFAYDTAPAPVPVITAPVAPISPATAASQTPAQAKTKANTTKIRALTWRTRAGVKYYNLQLFRNGRKILSAWPTAAHYTLRSTWRYRGHTHTLRAGRYRWFVWPGYGPRSAHRYGRLLAKGVVTVPKR